MSPLGDQWRRKMLVVTLTFCIISGTRALPVYPPAPAYPAVVDPYVAPSPYPADPYAPAPYPADPYVAAPYPADPYAAAPVYVPSVDVYYQVPQPVAYPAVDPYALPQAVPYDPYGLPQLYPAVDPYPSPYPSAYPSPYPSAYPSPQPYPSVDPYAQPAYPQPYAIDYLPQPPPPSYQVAPSYPIAPNYPSYQPPPQPIYIEQDTYLAITHHEHHLSRKHCGILPVTNDDIYISDPSPGGVNDVVPFGAFAWLALIVDVDDNSVVCLGTVIHSEYVLTVASCITKPASKYTVIKDWDILTIYNEYEAYKSYADPVCTYWPLGLDNSTEQTQYKLGGPEAELILLIGPMEEHHDKYPSDKILCLPSKSSALPSPYGYPAPSPSPYVPSVYSPYPQISYDYSNPIPTGECWVAGYLYSPTAILQNHPSPIGGQQQSPYNPYNQQYYNNLDNSKVPRRALIRQIQCPADHPYPGPDDVCFVGINGYDACVADAGTAIVCVIDDDTEYESGFDDDDSNDDHGSVPSGIPGSPPPPPQAPLQQQPIQVQPSPPKPYRRRGILYGVVKSTAQCLPPSPPGYPPNAQQQSNYIVGARVSPSIKGAIQDLFWETGYDLSCPTERVGSVLPDSGFLPPSPSSLSPPLPYSLAPLLQPQQYDPSLSYLTAAYPQPAALYPQPYQPPPYQPNLYSG